MVLKLPYKVLHRIHSNSIFIAFRRLPLRKRNYNPLPATFILHKTHFHPSTTAWGGIDPEQSKLFPVVSKDLWRNWWRIIIRTVSFSISDFRELGKRKCVIRHSKYLNKCQFIDCTMKQISNMKQNVKGRILSLDTYFELPHIQPDNYLIPY